MNFPRQIRDRVNRTRSVSMSARKTNGALRLILSNICPPTIVKIKVPSWPKKANMPIIVPRIALGMPRMSRTSIEMASTTVKMIRRQQSVIEVIDYGSVIHMNE